MDNPEKKKTALDETVDVLFNFAIDRTDIKTILAQLPDDIAVKPNLIDYELQLLKIIAVGWSLSFYLEASELKDAIGAQFWQSVNDFSQSVSQTTELMIGNEIDYFQTIKDRLNMYVKAMDNDPQAPEPAVIIGPEFAKACGNKDEIFAVMAGSRLFISVIGGVKAYLEEIKLR